MKELKEDQKKNLDQKKEICDIVPTEFLKKIVLKYHKNKNKCENKNENKNEKEEKIEVPPPPQVVINNLTKTEPKKKEKLAKTLAGVTIQLYGSTGYSLLGTTNNQANSNASTTDKLLDTVPNNQKPSQPNDTASNKLPDKSSDITNQSQSNNNNTQPNAQSSGASQKRKRLGKNERKKIKQSENFNRIDPNLVDLTNDQETDNYLRFNAAIRRTNEEQTDQNNEEEIDWNNPEEVQNYIASLEQTQSSTSNNLEQNEGD